MKLDVYGRRSAGLTCEARFDPSAVILRIEGKADPADWLEIILTRQEVWRLLATIDRTTDAAQREEGYRPAPAKLAKKG